MKRRFPTHLISLWLLIGFVGSVAAQPLQLEDVLRSSLQHYPSIQAAVQQKFRREAQVTQALGAFDLSLEQDALLWADGFFEGKSLDSRVVKPLQSANAKLFAGYRVTDDEFPIYQQELVTNDGGEFNFGFAVSLLRDRAIDDARFAIRNAEVNVRQADIDLTLEKLLAQRNAAQSYWRWLTAGQKLMVQRDLVDLAQNRMVAFEQRVEAGDVAQIFVTENRQNLLRRQALAVNAERDFANAGADLSLYLRDHNGEPRVAGERELPVVFPELESAIETTAMVVDDIVRRRPELGRIDNAAEAQRERLRLAKNALLPRVDLGLKAGHDLGDGSTSREGFEAIVDLTISVPLERRLGKGAVDAAEAKLKELELDRLLAEQQFAVEIQKLTTRINTALESVRLTDEEAQQAEIMEEAERRRFEAGASDFFLVNLREEHKANAQLRNLASKLDYFSGLTDFHAASVDLESLGIETAGSTD